MFNETLKADVCLCESSELLGLLITCFAFSINALGIIQKKKEEIYVFDWMVVICHHQSDVSSMFVYF